MKNSYQATSRAFVLMALCFLLFFNHANAETRDWKNKAGWDPVKEINDQLGMCGEQICYKIRFLLHPDEHLFHADLLPGRMKTGVEPPWALEADSLVVVQEVVLFNDSRTSIVLS